MYNNELYHYGVKGMRWGHRKKYYNSDGSLSQLGQARQTYRDSKKEFKRASRDQFRTDINIFKSFGREGIKRSENAAKRTNKAYGEMVSAKAKYNASKAKTAEKAEMAEFKTYKNSMKAYGLRGSGNDSSSGGRATAVYNAMKIQKGKAYADRVEKKIEKELVAQIVGGVAVAVGASVVQAMLDN